MRYIERCGAKHLVGCVAGDILRFSLDDKSELIYVLLENQNNCNFPVKCLILQGHIFDCSQGSCVKLSGIINASKPLFSNF